MRSSALVFLESAVSGSGDAMACLIIRRSSELRAAQKQRARTSAQGPTRRCTRASCLRVLEPDGLYLAASCSSHVDRVAFEESMHAPAGGRASEARLASARAYQRAGGSPAALGFSRGDYLKIVCSAALEHD